MADSTPAWEISGQQETVELGPAGTFVPGVKVSFRTATGDIGSVFLPHDQYTVERARAAVAERAATFSAVRGLKG